MKFQITARKVEAPEALKEKIELKFSKMDRYFRGDSTAQIVLGTERGRMIMEATIFNGGTIYRAESVSGDLYTCLDEAVDIIDRQIRKNKTRLQKRLKDDAFEGPVPEFLQVEEEGEFKLVKTKKFAFKPMDVEEAILQMNLLGHNFFVYKDIATNETCVVYKRKDGAYGLIEPQV